MDFPLVFRAGKEALQIIRDEGLRPERVQGLAGAAGGPKWLVLYHLDRYLFSDFFRERTHSLFLVGSSIGAWRFAALCRNRPLVSLKKFYDAYLGQYYPRPPSPGEVSSKTRRILDYFLPPEAAGEILNHPFCRLNILAVRSRGFLASDRKFPLALGLLLAYAANLADRRLLRLFFTRTVFSDPRTEDPGPERFS